MCCHLPLESWDNGLKFLLELCWMSLLIECLCCLKEGRSVFRRVVPNTQQQDLQNAKNMTLCKVQACSAVLERQTVTTWVAQYLQWPRQGIDYTTVGGAPSQTTILSLPRRFAQYWRGRPTPYIVDITGCFQGVNRPGHEADNSSPSRLQKRKWDWRHN